MTGDRKPRRQTRHCFMLLLFVLFIGARPEHLLGQTQKGGNDMTEGEKYSVGECSKKFAVELNNLVWDLLGNEARTKEEDQKMVHAAHASHYHWSEVGTAVNLQRGEWLISHVYAVLNRPDPALYHALRCMEITQEHDLVDFDLAYAYEGMARAYAAAGDKSECKKYLQLAKEAGEKIKAKEDKNIFFGDFESGPWYNMK